MSSTKLHGWYEAGGPWGVWQKVLFVNGQPWLTRYGASQEQMVDNLSLFKATLGQFCAQDTIYDEVARCDQSFIVKMNDPNHQKTMKKVADIRFDVDGKSFEDSSSGWLLGFGCLALIGSLAVVKKKAQQEATKVVHEKRLV